MKKIISVITMTALIIALAVPAFAAAITRDDYLSAYGAYSIYYSETYVPAYAAYNQRLAQLAADVQAADIQTAEQAERIIAFLTGLKQERDAFYGDRVTPGTSRYIVPDLRNQMREQYESGNYEEALSLCGDLLAAVTARVGFINGIIAEIDAFEIIESDSGSQNSGIGVTFNTVSDGQYYSTYTIVITNNSGATINGDWTLSFDYNGAMHDLWIDGKADVYISQSGSRYTVGVVGPDDYANCIMQNGESITISGNVNGNIGTSFANATLTFGGNTVSAATAFNG